MLRRMMMAVGGGGGSAFWAVPTYSTADGAVVSGLAARVGWSFEVSGGSLNCNSLRVILSATSAFNENVRIHRNSDGVLIAEANITPGAANVWAEVSVAPFTLANGVSYTISSRAGGSTREVRRNNTRTIISGLSSIANVSGTDNNRPVSPTANTYQFCDFGFV